MVESLARLVRDLMAIVYMFFVSRAAAPGHVIGCQLWSLEGGVAGSIGMQPRGWCVFLYCIGSANFPY